MLNRSQRDLFFSTIFGGDGLRILDLGAASEGEALLYESLLPITESILGIDAREDFAQGFESQLPDHLRPTCLTAFLGDGEVATWHQTARESVSSLYNPDEDLCATYSGYAEAAHVSTRREVATQRLDDLIPGFLPDLVKTDLQGADLLVLQHGRATIHSATVMLIEVEFVPQFTASPLFWETAHGLAALGWEFHSFLECGSRPVAGFDPRLARPQRGFSRWLWANAAFVRSTASVREMSARQVVAWAAITDMLLNSLDWCWWLLREADGRDGSQRAAAYLQVLKEGAAT